MAVKASVPEETLAFNIESENHAVASEALGPMFVPIELKNSPKLLPLNSTTKLPVTGTCNCAAPSITGFRNRMLARITVACVDGREITIE